MEPIYKIMARYSWSDIHYSNAFLPNDSPSHDKPNSWFIGVRTGPNNTDICIIPCYTVEDVNKYRSPAGNTLNEAIVKSKKKYDELILGVKISSCRKTSALIIGV